MFSKIYIKIFILFQISGYANFIHEKQEYFLNKIDEITSNNSKFVSENKTFEMKNIEITTNIFLGSYSHIEDTNIQNKKKQKYNCVNNARLLILDHFMIFCILFGQNDESITEKHGIDSNLISKGRFE